MAYYIKVNGKIATKPLTKAKAQSTAKSIRKDMRIAIPRYKWAKKIKVVKKKR